MINYITFRQGRPRASVLAHHDYQQVIAGPLDAGVFGLDWTVVDYGSGSVNITLNHRAMTWNRVPLDKVGETIDAAYRKELPYAVSFLNPRVHESLIDGIGLQVEHRLLNAHGELQASYNLNMLEKVLRVGVDNYRLTTRANNGIWHDHHRFGRRDNFDVGTKIAYQYWETCGPDGIRLPESGYIIEKVVVELGTDWRAVTIKKTPRDVDILGVKVRQAHGGSAAVAFEVRRAGDVWRRAQ